MAVDDLNEAVQAVALARVLIAKAQAHIDIEEGPFDLSIILRGALADLVHVSDEIALVQRFVQESTLLCPFCHTETVVYHTEWSAITCLRCRTDVAKRHWIAR